MKEDTKPNYEEIFYIWFDKNKKVEYYSTPLYFYNNEFRFDLDEKIHSLYYRKRKFRGEKIPTNWITPYKENLGLILTRFLNTDFNDFESAYKTFFFAYGFEYLKEYFKNIQFSDVYQNEKDFLKITNKMIEESKSKLLELQKHFKEAVDQIYGLNEGYDARVEKFSANAKFISGIIMHKNNLWRYCNNIDFILYNYTNKEVPYEDEEYYNLVARIDNGDTFIKKHNVYMSKSLSNILYVVLEHLVQVSNMPIKKCASCGKYFIPSNRQDEIYCDFPVEKGKTCKEKGALKTYKKNIENIPGLLLYRRTYQKRLMEISRNNDLELQEKQRKKFDKWKKQAQEKIKEFKAGKLTEDGLYNWMVKNKGK